MKEMIDEISNQFQNLIFWLGTGFVSGIGGIDGDITVLFYLVIIDCITGLLKAVKNGNVLSESLFTGFIIRKPSICLAIATMHQLDNASFMDDINFSLRVCMITGCILMESVSIIENLTQLGIKFPGIIEKVLAVKKEKLDKE